MPEGKEKNSKSTMSNWFRRHFGGKNKEKTSKELLLPLPRAQSKEESSKTSVTNTFKKVINNVVNPISKLIVKVKTKDDFEKLLVNMSDAQIKQLKSVKLAILYVKFCQLYGGNSSKVIMQGKPDKAAEYISDRIEVMKSNDLEGLEHPETLGRLYLLAQRIQKVKPKIWSALIKILDNSFDSKSGSDTLSVLANTKDNISDQQLETAILRLSPIAAFKNIKSTTSNKPLLSPSSVPTKTPPNKPLTSPSAVPTNISTVSSVKLRSPSETPVKGRSARPLPKPPQKPPVAPVKKTLGRKEDATPLDVVNQASKQWENDKEGLVKEAEKNMREQIAKERKEREEIRRKAQRNTSRPKGAGSVSIQDIDDLDNLISKKFGSKAEEAVPEDLDDLLKDF